MVIRIISSKLRGFAFAFESKLWYRSESADQRRLVFGPLDRIHFRHYIALADKLTVCQVESGHRHQVPFQGDMSVPGESTDERLDNLVAGCRSARPQQSPDAVRRHLGPPRTATDGQCSGIEWTTTAEGGLPEPQQTNEGRHMLQGQATAQRRIA